MDCTIALGCSECQSLPLCIQTSQYFYRDSDSWSAVCFVSRTSLAVNCDCECSRVLSGIGIGPALRITQHSSIGNSQSVRPALCYAFALTTGLRQLDLARIGEGTLTLHVTVCVLSVWLAVAVCPIFTRVMMTHVLRPHLPLISTCAESGHAPHTCLSNFLYPTVSVRS